ncbi:MAG: hypothetical protein HZA01_05555 [Nitrospinae bacterium]|nr:hypothetical protein [Nitrospinota bacterium]
MADLKTILQNFVRCCLWAVGLIAWAVLMFVDIFANFSSIRTGLEYLSQKPPLSEDPLLGIFIAAFGIGDANYNYMLAGLTAVLLTSLLFAAVCEIKQIIGVLQHMVDTENREYSSNELKRTLLTRSLYLALYASFLWPIVTFDLNMFRYQTLIDVLSQNANQGAVTIDINTPDWETYEKNNPHSAIINTGNAIAYCYLALAIAGAFLFDVIVKNFHSSTTIFYDSIFRGADDEAHVSSVSSIVPAQAGGTRVTESGQTKNIDISESSGNIPETLTGTLEEDAQEIEVIGSNPVITVPFQEARSNPQYHVDDEGRVWDRQFYQEIHGK